MAVTIVQMLVIHNRNKTKNEIKILLKIYIKYGFLILRRERDREYAFQSLQDLYTFSIREYTHKEKLFESRTQDK